MRRARTPAVRYGSKWRAAIAATVAAVGAVNILSSASHAERSRLAHLRSIVPLAATQVATAATAVAGVALLVLARQLYLGKRRAMLMAVGLLAGSVVLHLAKGLDVEEALVAASIIPILIARRRDFFAEGDPASLRRAVRTVPLLVGTSIGFGIATLWLDRRHIEPAFGLGPALRHTIAGLVLLPGPLRVPGRTGQILGGTLATLGIGTAAFTLFLLFRPVIASLSRQPDDIRDARRIVREHGDDSLSYFALRSDKNYFFDETRTAFLAYRYIAGYALVSGDPIGPAQRWPALLEQFDRYRLRHGWRLAIVGAGEDSLPLYHGFGYRSYHMGNEAVIDPQTFSLEGRALRNVRQSAAHIRRLGYEFRLLDARELDATTRKQMLDLSSRWLEGKRETGFSMALGRIAAAEDDGWLIAAAFDPQGVVQGFVQLVPFARGRGFSLDAMRRNRSGPAGLNEFLITETAAALRRRGCRALSLNFAALAGRSDPIRGIHVIRRLERRLIKILSRSYQIESLERFNAKFDPQWRPRSIIFEEPRDLLRAGLAIAQAEAFIRIPGVGRPR